MDLTPNSPPIPEDILPQIPDTPSQKRKRSRSDASTNLTISHAPKRSEMDMDVESQIDNGVGNSKSNTMGEQPCIGFPTAAQPQWQEMIEKAVRSIVSIRFSQVASFDTESADTSEGMRWE